MISVIMPIYRAEKYIQRSIQSILGQTFGDFELILVDDCGGDQTMEIVEKIYDSRIVNLRNEKNSGIAYSRNRALKVSRGKYIAIMDDDDVALPYRFEKQIQFMEENPSVDIVGGRVEWIDENDEVIREAIDVATDKEWIRAYFLFYNIFNNSEVMVRQNFLKDQNIWYRNGMLGMEDFDFWMRCSKTAEMSNLQEILLRKRVVASNETMYVKRNMFEARAEKYKQIQKESLRLSGFELSEAELDTILGLIKEDALNVCTRIEQVHDIYLILAKMITQASVKNMSFLAVLKSWFHMLFIEIIKNMEDDSVWTT